tara:strand:+ start:793 stop:948 length:156 start_codon:yes stop_codon:yes gene_type:complete
MVEADGLPLPPAPVNVTLTLVRSMPESPVGVPLITVAVPSLPVPIVVSVKV